MERFMTIVTSPKQVHDAGGLLVVATDLLSLTLLKPPGEFDADIAVGSTQRFGVPMGYGGPHAAFLSTQEKFKRKMPGRIAGLSQDIEGQPAIRLALQTREQHIRREQATSNICTAQVLLAVMASMYAVYHGPQGLRRIAERIHLLTGVLREGLKRVGYVLDDSYYFDTFSFDLNSLKESNYSHDSGANQQRSTPLTLDDLLSIARGHQINLRIFDHSHVGISLDETTSIQDIRDLLDIFALGRPLPFEVEGLILRAQSAIPEPLQRKSPYLTHPVFSTYHSETEMLRYIHKLQEKDLSLTTSMIPLGSCTMKLNATVEMLAVTWPRIRSTPPVCSP